MVTDRDKIRSLLQICNTPFRETDKTIYMKDRSMVFDDDGNVVRIFQDGMMFTEDH